MSNNNYFYYNIIDTISRATNKHFSPVDYITGIYMAPLDQPNNDNTGNYIFNNTFYTSYFPLVYVQNSDNYIYNNLFLDVYTSTIVGDRFSMDAFDDEVTFKNNIHHATGQTTADYAYKYKVTGAFYTISGMNALTNKTGNINYTGALGSLINTTTWNVSGSAVGSGIVIDDLIPALFKDRNGNIIVQDGVTKPNIGAIDN
jgi:hypothetical protein